MGNFDVLKWRWAMQISYTCWSPDLASIRMHGRRGYLLSSSMSSMLPSCATSQSLALRNTDQAWCYSGIGLIEHDISAQVGLS